jgi:hypothetical protein
MIKRAAYLDPLYEERLDQHPSTEKEMIKRAAYLDPLYEERLVEGLSTFVVNALSSLRIVFLERKYL